jgi:hypothetical protein
MRKTFEHLSTVHLKIHHMSLKQMLVCPGSIDSRLSSLSRRKFFQSFSKKHVICWSSSILLRNLVLTIFMIRKVKFYG